MWLYLIHFRIMVIDDGEIILLAFQAKRVAAIVAMISCCLGADGAVGGDC